jgi:hypothetical protein
MCWAISRELRFCSRTTAQSVMSSLPHDPMNAAKRKAKFEEHLTEIVQGFAKECHKNKKIALRLKISAVFLSGVVTVCLGLKFSGAATPWQTWLSNLALFLSAVITVVGAYEAFFDPRAIWIRETIVYTKLRNLKREFEFWAAGCDGEMLEPTEAEQLDRFKDQLDQILIESLKNWMKIRGATEADQKPAANGTDPAREEADARGNLSKNS